MSLTNWTYWVIKKAMKLEGGHVDGVYVEGVGEKVGVAYDHISLYICMKF